MPALTTPRPYNPQADPLLPLTLGARLGPYEILSALGAGGMGEVYRARDTRLKREVALKILPDSFAADPERLARFQREAEVLASLNHPHIAQIYGLEDIGAGGRALVMELVEGEDLSQRIVRGAVPIDEALPIAKQIAEALEAAHEQGIIHRDLKPANIKITPDGVVKVLDFGLAKLAHSEVAAGHADVTASPTITSPAMMSGIGMILGTAAYMAPEQAKGREADKRSDIWAFGCVLYEMLTGKRPFDGEDVGDTLANVLKIDPDWSALSMETPPPIRTLLQSCLTKDRRRRVADISTALFVLDKAASLAPSDGMLSAAPLPSRPLWRRIVPLTAGALVTAAVTGAGVWVLMRPADPVPLRVSRLPLAPSGTASLSISGGDRELAIFSDGSHVVYVGNRGTQLFIRALDTLEPVAVFTGTPRAPFVSSDGEWIGFLDNNSVLKKVAATGGPAVTIATLDQLFAGATWGPDDVIIFATANATTGLQRIGAAGGPTTVLARPDRAQGEAGYSWPELLPGGRAVLFTIITAPGGLDTSQVVVLDLQTGARKILVRGGSDAHYVPTGHLVYAAAGTLRAVAFDLARLETRGTTVPVISAVVTSPFGAAAAAVAGDGTLVYLSGAGGMGAQRTLVWVDRQGRETPIPAPPHAYVYPQLSPDGTRVAVNAQDQENDVWIWNFSRTTLTRATSDPSFDGYPVWTPDGGRLVFGSARAGSVNLYLQAVDGTGSATRLTESVNQQFPTAITNRRHVRRLQRADAEPPARSAAADAYADAACRAAARDAL